MKTVVPETTGAEASAPSPVNCQSKALLVRSRACKLLPPVKKPTLPLNAGARSEKNSPVVAPVAASWTAPVEPQPVPLLSCALRR